MQALINEGPSFNDDVYLSKKANSQEVSSSFSVRPDDRAALEPATRTSALKLESRAPINEKVANHANLVLKLESCKVRSEEECEPSLRLIRTKLFSFAPNRMKSIKISLSEFILIEIQSELPKIYKKLPLKEIKLSHEIKQLRNTIAIIHFFLTGIDYRINGITHPLFFLTKEDFFITLANVFDETIEKIKEALSEKDPYSEKFFLSNKGKELKAQVLKVIDPLSFLSGLIKKKSDAVMRVLQSAPMNLDSPLEAEPRTSTDWLNLAKSFLIHLKIGIKEVFPIESEAVLGISTAIKYADHYLKKKIQPKDIKLLQTLVYNSTIETLALCEEDLDKQREELQKSEAFLSLNEMPRFEKMRYQIEVAKPNVYSFTLSAFEAMNHALVMALEVLLRETKGGVDVRAKENFFEMASLILERLKREAIGDEIEELYGLKLLLKRYKKLKNEDVLYLFFGSMHLIDELENFIENMTVTRVQIFRTILEDIKTGKGKGANLTLDFFLTQVKAIHEFFEGLSTLAGSITYFRRKMLYFVEEKHVREKPVKKKGNTKAAFKKKTSERTKHKKSNGKAKKVPKKTPSQAFFTQDSLSADEPMAAKSLVEETSPLVEKFSFEEQKVESESHQAIEKTFHEKKMELFQSAQQTKRGIKKPRPGGRFEGRESLRNVSSKELLKELIKAGWERKKSIGGHAQFVLPGRSDLGRVTVPINNKRDGVSIKTVQNVKNSIKMGKSNN